MDQVVCLREAMFGIKNRFGSCHFFEDKYFMKIATKKRLIIFLIIFTFLIITLIVSYSIYCKYMFNKWIKPFCDNQNIMLIDDSDDCKIYNYFESETGLSYTLSKGSFPFYSYANKNRRKRYFVNRSHY